MKKRFLTTTLVFTLGFSAISAIPAAVHPINVSAATTNSYNNQQAVETKANQLIQTAKSLNRESNNIASIGSCINTTNIQFLMCDISYYIF